jgi:hypothetical protein
MTRRRVLPFRLTPRGGYPLGSVLERVSGRFGGMSWRTPPERPLASREFVDDALGELRASRWSAQGWVRFLAQNLARSWDQVVRHPRAASELTVEHLALLAPRPGPWAVASWGLAVTHLGLLGKDGDDSH